MKIFLLLLVLIVSSVFGLKHTRSKTIPFTENIYRSSKYNYQITVPPNFRIIDDVPDLVLIERDLIRLRINSGCYEFGTEGLTQTQELITLDNLPAWRESYYENSELKFKKIALNYDGICYSLEMFGKSEIEWSELESIAQTFRLNR